jgi:retron-type reverse transcriptase
VRGEYPSSIEGTPQGGVISPLLANIALNGIEDCFKNKDITCLRYADDLVFICKPGVNIYGLRLSINFFLEERGLQIKESKTKLVKATEGFDFLGWNFKVKPNGKFISTPTKDNTKKVKDKIKETMKDSRFTLEQRITKCGALVRGWRNYNKFCDMTGHNLWAQALWTWKFIRKQGRYGRKGTTEVIHKAFPSVSHSVNSHIKVKGDKSVFDNDLTYWAKRHNKNYTGITALLWRNKITNAKPADCHSLVGIKWSYTMLMGTMIIGNRRTWKRCTDFVTSTSQSTERFVQLEIPKRKSRY